MCMEDDMKEQPLNPPDIEYPSESEDEADNLDRAEIRRENENEAKRKGTW